MSIELTESQRRAVAEAGGTPPAVTDPATGTDYVLVRREEYERLKSLVYDDSPWADEERDGLRAEAVESLGWEGMEAYQDGEP